MINASSQGGKLRVVRGPTCLPPCPWRGTTMTTMTMMSWDHPTTATALRDCLHPCLPPHRRSMLRVDVNVDVASYRRRLPFVPLTKTLTPSSATPLSYRSVFQFHVSVSRPATNSSTAWKGTTTTMTTTMSWHCIVMWSKTLLFLVVNLI